MTDLHVRAESWPLCGEFRISRGARTRAEVVVAELQMGLAAVLAHRFLTVSGQASWFDGKQLASFIYRWIHPQG